MIDQHFTPPDIAEFITSSLPDNFSPKIIADFAAGSGALLKPASTRWPSAEFISNDSAKQTVRRSTKANPSWIHCQVDFFDDLAVLASPLRYYFKKADLILINPPFSQRGIAPANVTFLGSTIRCGVAVRFLIKALDFLSDSGHLVAVLPLGCFSSARDSLAWQALEKFYAVRIISTHGSRTFANVSAKVRVVQLVRRKIPRSPVSYDDYVLPKSVQVVRGSTQMHERLASKRNGHPLVHTTCLAEGNLIDIYGRHLGKTVSGPAVLIPRVGKINRGKICVLSSGYQVVLSDCVIAIKCDRVGHARLLRSALISNWDFFSGIYSGTGAPYTTLSSVIKFLSWLYRRGLVECRGEPGSPFRRLLQ